jgi:site-specific recombinase XerD
MEVPLKPLKNPYGSVKPYTRHEADCEHKSDPDHNDCRCAKWLYVNQRGTKPYRKSLKDPSWASAMGKAQEALDGFHPEIAEARSKQQAEAQREVEEKTTIEEAVQMWLDRTEHMYGRGGTYDQYRSLFNRLVCYVDKQNLGKPQAERIARIRQLTPDFCTKWYQSWRYSNTVMRQRWGVVRSFFNYLHQQGKIAVNPAITIKAVPRARTYSNVPFSDHHYRDILNCTAKIEDAVARTSDTKVYRGRLYIFIELLRWTGMDIGDAVQYRPAMLDARGVLRYIRTKTGVQAVIPLADLAPHMIELLKEIPLAPGSIPDMPFRYAENDLASDVHNWSRRIRRVLDGAGVVEVQLVEKSGVPAFDRNGNPIMKATNAKMFRHTFAVNCLIDGIPKDNLARMLGHVGTEMIDKHYAPWVKGLDDAHILKVREVMAHAKPRKNLRVVASDGVRVAAASH